MASKAISLLVNLKHKSGNLHHGKRKKQMANDQLSNLTKVSKEKEPGRKGGGGAAKSLVLFLVMAGNVFIREGHP